MKCSTGYQILLFSCLYTQRNDFLEVIMDPLRFLHTFLVCLEFDLFFTNPQVLQSKQKVLKYSFMLVIV